MKLGRSLATYAIVSITVVNVLGLSGAVPVDQTSRASAHVVAPSPVPSPRGASAHPIVLALLADNQLVAIDTKAGRIVAKQAMAPVPSVTRRDYGYFIRMGANGDRLYVLVAGDSPATSRLAVLDWPTLTVVMPNLLPQTSVIYRSLAVGPHTGRLYLFGNLGNSAVVTILDPVHGHLLGSLTARPTGSYNWWVYQGSVSADEHRLYISYHGPNTTGIDWIDITPSGLERCRLPSRPKIGCLASHGGFRFLDGEILAATGMSQILGFGQEGTLQHQWDTKLEGNHLMEFAVDPSAGKLYAVGSCGYAGGFSALSLASDKAVVVPGVRRADGTMSGPCGERIALVDHQLLVVAQEAMPVAQVSSPGSVLFVDAKTGEVVRDVPTASGPIDVYAVPGLSSNSGV